MAGQKMPTARPGRRSEWYLPPARWMIALGLVGLLITAAAALHVWGHPGGWLHSPRILVDAALRWVRVHWLTSGAVGVLMTMLVYVLQRRAERHRIWAEQQERESAVQTAEGQRQAAAKAALATLLSNHCWVDEATGWLPRVQQISDPVALGVHPAVHLVSVATAAPIPKRSQNAPVYVPRDVDSSLDQAMVRSGFVLLVGDSTAGKSRAAFEAMHRNLGDRWLLVPSKRESLRALLDAGVQFRDTVVWLNDLERYMGPDGLDEGLLRRLLGNGTRRVVILATMRATEYALRSPIHDLGQSDHERVRRRGEQILLDQVTYRLEVARRFSDSEQQEAHARSRDDPRIFDALRYADRYGLAEYLAAGPKLLQEWHNAWAIGNQPAGAALVATAVDCRRAGLDEPVPANDLLELAPTYVDNTVAGLLGANAFQDGLEWASTPRYGASALLIRQSDSGYLAFDYLVDSLQGDPSAPPIPDAVWQKVVALAKGDTARSVALRADYAKPRRLEIAELAYRKAAESQDVDSIRTVGYLAEARHDRDEAVAWYRRAADVGDLDSIRHLGRLAESNEEAKAWYRVGASAGDLEAIRELQRLAEPDEAIVWCRKGADAGDLESMRRLASLSPDRGEAAAWLLRAADIGDVYSMHRLGQRAESDPSALAALRTAANAGALWAMHQLRLGAESGSSSALEALHTAAHAGAVWAMEMLGWLAKKHSDEHEAEAWFRRASMPATLRRYAS
jgi:hypothetical protein